MVRRYPVLINAFWINLYLPILTVIIPNITGKINAFGVFFDLFFDLLLLWCCFFAVDFFDLMW